MKKICLLCLMLCISLWANAQATSLTVDNQTPGWLSSKINYGDQLTVRELQVTGFINSTDLYFIGTLFGKQNLKVLDLRDANLTGNKDDYWNGGMGGYENYGYIPIQKLVLPKSLKEMDTPVWLKIDSLIIDTKINRIENMQSSEFQYLLLGENVDSIMFNAFANSTINSFYMPRSTKYIEDNAFYNVEFGDMKFLNNSVFLNTEYIGSCAFVNRNNSNRENLPDTLRFPKIKEYGLSAFDYKEGMHIYWGKDIREIDYKEGTYDFIPSVKNVTFHIESLTPPITSTYYIWNKGVDVYVPKEAVEEYKVSQCWVYANILPEPRLLQKIVIDVHELELVIGEKKDLIAALIPENPDNSNILWKSENEEVASVDENGTITASKPGEAWIKVVSVDNPEARDSCKVKVLQPVTGIELSNSTYVLESIGDSGQITASVHPEDASNKEVNWKSSNESICVVSNGTIVAVGYGTAVVIATTVDGGFMDVCVVTVEDNTPVSGIDADVQSYKVFDMKGVQRSRLVKGLNIIRFSDGTTKKVII